MFKKSLLVIALAFAVQIPIALAQSVGKVVDCERSRGIGVTSAYNAHDKTLFIAHVIAGSPAAQAGLSPKMRIVAFNGVNVSSFSDEDSALAALTNSTKISSQMTLTIKGMSEQILVVPDMYCANDGILVFVQENENPDVAFDVMLVLKANELILPTTPAAKE